MCKVNLLLKKGVMFNDYIVSKTNGLSNLTIRQSPLPLGRLLSMWQGVESTKQRDLTVS